MPVTTKGGITFCDDGRTVLSSGEPGPPMADVAHAMSTNGAGQAADHGDAETAASEPRNTKKKMASSSSSSSSAAEPAASSAHEPARERPLVIAQRAKDLGNGALSKGDLTLAVMLYSEALEVLLQRAEDDDHPDATTTTSSSQRRRPETDDDDEAPEDNTHSTDDDDAEVTALTTVLYANRAMAHIKAESYGLAIADAEAAIKLDPTYVKAYYRRGSANMAIGKYKQALKDFRSVCKLRPTDKDARSKLKACDKAAKQLAFAAAIESQHGGLGYSTDEAAVDASAIVVEDAYDGPRLDDEALGASSDEIVVSDDFVRQAMDRFRDQKLVHRRYVIRILQRVRTILDAEPSLVDLAFGSGSSSSSKEEDDASSDETTSNGEATHYTICGDVHGQYYDLLRVFDLNGVPSATNPYVFNGDFVDRGSFSFEVVMTLFMLKARHPRSIHLNRGNHETKNMTKIYGFEGEVKHKFDVAVLALFHECFCALPLAACLEHKIFVVHGGLSSDDDVTLDDVRKLERRKEPPDAGLMCDLLWSDPQPTPGRAPSKRGVGLSFGPDVTKRFLERNDLNLVIRSHEVRDNGYELEHDGNLITVFSAPNYCDAMGNKGAFVKIGRDLVPKFTTYDAAPHPQIRPMAYASPSFGVL